MFPGPRAAHSQEWSAGRGLARSRHSVAPPRSPGWPTHLAGFHPLPAELSVGRPHGLYHKGSRHEAAGKGHGLIAKGREEVGGDTK